METKRMVIYIIGLIAFLGCITSVVLSITTGFKFDEQFAGSEIVIVGKIEKSLSIFAITEQNVKKKDFSSRGRMYNCIKVINILKGSLINEKDYLKIFEEIGEIRLEGPRIVLGKKYLLFLKEKKLTDYEKQVLELKEPFYEIIFDINGAINLDDLPKNQDILDKVKEIINKKPKEK